MGFSLKTQKTSLGSSRFPQERAMGITYYGYRYYNPAVGPMINHDPIEENEKFIKHYLCRR